MLKMRTMFLDKGIKAMLASDKATFTQGNSSILPKASYTEGCMLDTLLTS